MKTQSLVDQRLENLEKQLGQASSFSQEEFEALKKNVNDNKDAISNLTTKIENQGKKLEEIENLISSLSTNLSSLQAKIANETNI